MYPTPFPPIPYSKLTISLQSSATTVHRATYHQAFVHFRSHQVLVHSLIVYLVYSRSIMLFPQHKANLPPKRAGEVAQNADPLQQYHTTKGSQSASESIQSLPSQ